MCFKRHGHLMPGAEREIPSDRQAVPLVGLDFVDAALRARAVEQKRLETRR